MLDKNSTTTDKYKPNNRTTVTVKNNRIEDERGNTFYRSEVTIKHKLTADEPVSFNSVDAIADFVNNIDLEDPQLSLNIQESQNAQE